MAVVLVVAGGIREEVQRAFLLRRFEQWLGGPVVGVIVASIGFGAGHIIQGRDVAVVTGCSGCSGPSSTCGGDRSSPRASATQASISCSWRSS
jgi:hypothetical protein